ncbi:MAG: hypothetical protein K1X89_15170 [Myxococcaceae bacterium]|nr:hypothetical protein [Myxococcaceae bacterium]
MVSLALALLLARPPAAAAVTVPAPDEPAIADDDGETISSNDSRRVSWSLTSTNRNSVAGGRTRVSAVVSAPSPRSGYGLLQVEVDNSLGPDGTVRLVYSSNNAGARPAQKLVPVRAGERRQVLMPVPFHWRYGTLRASGAGIDETHNASVYFNAVYPVQPVVLSLGSESETEHFLKSRPQNNTGKSNITVVTLPAAQAPTELAAYVGFDAVLLPKLGLESLAEGQRAALEGYAATGGTLVLGTVSRAVEQALPLLADDGHGTYGFGRVVRCNDCTLVLGDFSHQVPVTPSNVGTLGNRYRYMGTSGDESTPLLPQATVPVARFLVIILLFTLAIGPGSVFVARRRGPSALLVTVPATAFATCVLIIGIAAFRDGFTVHASAQGYTLLDSARHRAITVGNTAYYANLAPSGAQLPVTTAVVGPTNESGEPYATSLDWTQGLALGGDFVPSRTYREWGFLAVEPTRARVVVKEAGGQVRVQNALGAPVSSLAVALGTQVYVVKGLRDGEEGVAQPDGLPELALSRAAAARFAEPVRDRLSAQLRSGEFVAALEGQGFTPTAGLRVSHSDSAHLVRGEVER